MEIDLVCNMEVNPETAAAEAEYGQDLVMNGNIQSPLLFSKILAVYMQVIR